MNSCVARICGVACRNFSHPGFGRALERPRVPGCRQRQRPPRRGRFCHRRRFGRHDRDRHDRRDRDHRRDRRDFDRGDFFGPWNYSYDFDGNRSFDPDKWNDWWHERPWRAYPRWVQNNRDCEPERMWQGGGVWRCSW